MGVIFGPLITKPNTLHRITQSVSAIGFTLCFARYVYVHFATILKYIKRRVLYTKKRMCVLRDA